MSAREVIQDELISLTDGVLDDLGPRIQAIVDDAKSALALAEAFQAVHLGGLYDGQNDELDHAKSDKRQIAAEIDRCVTFEDIIRILAAHDIPVATGADTLRSVRGVVPDPDPKGVWEEIAVIRNPPVDSGP